MRGSGILLHISSLPSRYGIGTLGREAYEFIDFLKDAGQKYWQVLPIGPTSYGDSPYQTFSVFAGNPYFIDLEILMAEGLLFEDECRLLDLPDPGKVDYAFQYYHRFNILRLAFSRFTQNKYPDDYLEFRNQNRTWLDDYALFMAIKDVMPEGNWAGWDENYKKRDAGTLKHFQKEHANDIEFWKFIQYKFQEQWLALKAYANSRDIAIIGDMPIYVAYDSSDVWSDPKYWQLDENLDPITVAGCPPDAYAITGQLWGNPIYNYDLMDKEGFRWWIERIRASFQLFDVVRIDHFRGFESYYSIPFTDKTAEFGVWVKGPGMKLFNAVKEAVGDVNIIAEDLGFLTQAVYDLLRDCGYPGMKILQFGFDPYGDSEYAPHNYKKHSIVYPGTHDNPTLLGWYHNLKEDERQYFDRYLQIDDPSRMVEKAIKECLKSVPETAIIPMQDYLELGDEARFNIPSTLGGNWIWRLPRGSLTPELAAKIASWVKLYRR